jgi:hypothetical protein
VGKARQPQISEGLARRLSGLTDELLLLMRVKARAIDLAHYPEILRAPAVKAAAKRLEIELTDPSALRRVLTEILKELRVEEHEVAATHREEGLVPDRPLAEPALRLLGLTATTAHKDIGARRASAATVRGIARSTMRRHGTKVIAEEIAQLLLSHDLGLQRPGQPRSRSSAANCGNEQPDRTPPPDLVALSRQIVTVADALEHLSWAPINAALNQLAAESGRESPPYDRDYDVFFLLKALYTPPSVLGISTAGPLKFWLLTIPHAIDQADQPGTAAWLYTLYILIEVITDPLPAFSLREEELLALAARDSASTVHFFIRKLEEDPIGPAIMERWSGWVERASGKEGEPDSLLAAITEAGRHAKLLVSEDVVREPGWPVPAEIREFIDKHGRPGALGHLDSMGAGLDE